MAAPDGRRRAGGAAPRREDLGTATARKINTPAWNLLLVLPLIGTLIPAFYNKLDPRLFGIPFFYWYEMAWIPISALVTVVVYRATRGER